MSQSLSLKHFVLVRKSLSQTHYGELLLSLRFVIVSRKYFDLGEVLPGYFLSGVMYWMAKVKTLVRALLVSAETSTRA